MKYHAVLSIFFFISIFFFPWYVTVVLGLVLIALSNAPEVIAGGFLLDTLYGTPVAGYMNTSFLFTALFIILYVLALYLKRRFVFYT